MVSPFSAWIAFGPRFGTLLGSVWESISPPRWLKPVSKEPWGRPRADPNYFFGRQMQKWMLTWRVLERSRTLSGGQGAPRCLWAAIWDVFRLHVDLIWTLKPPPGVFSQAMLSRFSPRQGIESSILAGQQNCRSCKISASGMLSARWPVSGAQPPVRSGHRASVKEAGCCRVAKRGWSQVACFSPKLRKAQRLYL